MKNKQKGFIVPLLIGIVILLLIGGGVYFYLNNNKIENQKLNNSSLSTTYKNNLFGYELTVQPEWHISEFVSKKIDTSLFMMNLYNSVGCDINTFIEKDDYETALPKLQECLKKSPDLIKIDSEYKDFEKSWTLETTHNIFITKLSSTDEQKLTLADLLTAESSLPKGSFILMRPFDSDMSFKEATSTKSGTKKSFYFLGDNTKSYLVDWRDTKLSSMGLILSIPISSEINMLYAGGKIQTITVISTAGVGTQEEKDFFNTLNSFKLNKLL